MATLPAEEARNKILLALYEITQAQQSPHVKTDELEARADVGPAFYEALRFMGRKGKCWLELANMRVSITPAGEEKAEEIIKMNMAEKQSMVLRKTYDLGGESHMEFVDISRLQRELGIPMNELISIINWIERSTNLFDDNLDQAIRLSPAGVREVESPSSERRGGDIPNIQFNAPIQGGIQIGGSHNVQKNVYNNNPKVDEAADALIKLIQASGIAELDKEDLIKDVERLKELGAKEKTPEVSERAKRRLELIKTGLEVAEKGGSLALKASPYLVILGQLFGA